MNEWIKYVNPGLLISSSAGSLCVYYMTYYAHIYYIYI